MNIQCSVSGCNNPVIGQCTGYKGDCGKFYCAQHSSDGLCAECVAQKAHDEFVAKTFAEYWQLADQVKRESEPFSEALILW